MYQLGSKQFATSAYRPQSQGARERFYQTLKTMIKTYYKEFEKDWNGGIHFQLFAARYAVQQSFEFIPFEVVFGHSISGSLKILKDILWNDYSPYNVLEFVSKFRQRIQAA